MLCDVNRGKNCMIFGARFAAQRAAKDVLIVCGLYHRILSIVQFVINILVREAGMNFIMRCRGRGSRTRKRRTNKGDQCSHLLGKK